MSTPSHRAPAFLEDALLDKPGMRRAALLLHAMAPIDQAFVLNALPTEQAEALRGLVSELEVLGIARDPSLIAAATGSDAARAASTTQSSAIDRRLGPENEEQIAAVARLLSAEPAALVAYWLHLADRPRRESVLEALEPAQRRRVDAFVDAQHGALDVPPALRGALLRAVSSLLEVSRRASQPAPENLRAVPFLKDAIEAIRQSRWMRRSTRS